MKIFKFAKGLVLSAVLSAGCFCMAAACSAEAKAFEYESVLRGSYIHVLHDEFFTRRANMYNTSNQSNDWCEVIVREESGQDGSVTKRWLIGDIRRDSDNNFFFTVRRHVTQKLDNRGNIEMNKVEDVGYNVNLYPRMASGIKLEWLTTGTGPSADIDGEYTAISEYPEMSKEAAMYVLYRFMRSNSRYREKLLGAAMVMEGGDMAEIHTIRLAEPHPDHFVTRGIYQVFASGTILEYDTAKDKWVELTK